MQCTCVEASAFITFLHSFGQVFPPICHPSVSLEYQRFTACRFETWLFKDSLILNKLDFKFHKPLLHHNSICSKKSHRFAKAKYTFQTWCGWVFDTENTDFVQTLTFFMDLTKVITKKKFSAMLRDHMDTTGNHTLDYKTRQKYLSKLIKC